MPPYPTIKSNPYVKLKAAKTEHVLFFIFCFDFILLSRKSDGFTVALFFGQIFTHLELPISKFSD